MLSDTISPSVVVGFSVSEAPDSEFSFSLAATSLTRADLTAGSVTKATPVNSPAKTFIVPSFCIS